MQTQRIYRSAEEIPDAVVVDTFRNVSKIQFSARRFNLIRYRRVGIGDLGWWLPLERVLSLLGITPAMLLPVFGLAIVPKKKQPWSRRVPVTIEILGLPSSYEELGCINLAPESFCKLAGVLGKDIEVFRESGGTGEHNLLFTACASGEIVRHL